MFKVRSLQPIVITSVVTAGFCYVVQTGHNVSAPQLATSHSPAASNRSPQSSSDPGISQHSVAYNQPPDTIFEQNRKPDQSSTAGYFGPGSQAATAQPVPVRKTWNLEQRIQSGSDLPQPANLGEATPPTVRRVGIRNAKFNGSLISSSRSSTLGLVLPEGTPVPLRLAQNISSKEMEEGDPVSLILSENLTVDGTVVARAGIPATGQIVTAKRAGRVGKGGHLSMRIDYLDVGENKIALRGVKGRAGDSKTGQVIILSPIFGALTLLQRGKNAELQAGTPISAFVAESKVLPPAL